MTKLGRRSKMRFPLELPVDLVWEGSEGKPRATRAWTKDLSSSGAFIILDPNLQLNQPVHFWVRLPAVGPKSSVGLECQGRVVRVQPAGLVKGIGVTIETYQFGREISYQAVPGQA